jgi:hypothetical protein
VGWALACGGLQAACGRKFNSVLNRVDYNFRDRHKIYGKWYWNHRLADEYDFTHDTLHGLESDGLVRINKGGSGDYVWTINSTTILDITGAFERFNEGNVNTIRSFEPAKMLFEDVGHTRTCWRRWEGSVGIRAGG